MVTSMTTILGNTATTSSKQQDAWDIAQIWITRSHMWVLATRKQGRLEVNVFLQEHRVSRQCHGFANIIEVVIVLAMVMS